MINDRPEIFTAPFTALEALKKAGIRAVAISRFLPDFAKGMDHFIKLAPSEKLLSDFKEGLVSQQAFTAVYAATTLTEFPTIQCIYPELLAQFGGKQDLALVCWERAGAFCHRRIVAEVMYYANGFPVVEWSSVKAAPPTTQPLFRRRT